MTYVPIVPVQTPQPPSRQTQELADLLGRVIQEYEKAHPTVTGGEVSQALQLAKRASSKASKGDQMAVVVALATGLAVMLGLGVFLFIQQGGGEFRIANLQVMIGVVALGVAAVVVAVARRGA